MAKIHKVLVVGHDDGCMEPAYEIVSYLAQYGYSTDLCHANDDDNPSRIKAIQTLDNETSLAGYEGIIFLDDGASPECAVNLAKKAAEKEIVVGGYGEGLRVIREADIFEDNYVCNAFTEENEGITIVDAPAVRSENIVTSRDSCPLGFAILMIDALGGKIKHIVRASDKLPDRCSLVISPLARWSNYWSLAKKMREGNSHIVMADWDDINLDERKMLQCALLDTDKGDIVMLSDQPIPRNIWFKEADLTKEAIADAVESMEKLGCVNVNSSEAIRTINSMETAQLLMSISNMPYWIFGKNEIDQMSQLLLSKGTKVVSASNESFRVTGHGDKALISRKSGSSVTDQMLLKKTLKTFGNNGPIIVKKAARGLRLGDQRFKLLWIMRRHQDGWRPASRLARSAEMTCYAQDVIRLVLPDEMKSIMEDADALAQLVSTVLQSLMEDQDGLSEMMLVMDIHDGPFIDDAIAIPDSQCPCRARLANIASAMGQEFENVAVPEEEDPSEMLHAMMHDPIHRIVIERELANEGVWLQPDGTIAVRTLSGIDKISSFEDMIERFRQEAIDTVREEIEKIDRVDDVEVRMASRLSRRARHRLRLAIEMYSILNSDNVIKKAFLANDASGHFVNLYIPMAERVYEFDHTLTDKDDAITNGPRYKRKEYFKTSPNDAYGIYAYWPEPNRDPVSWIHSLEGDTVYKTRNLLSPGKLY